MNYAFSVTIYEVDDAWCFKSVSILKLCIVFKRCVSECHTCEMSKTVMEKAVHSVGCSKYQCGSDIHNYEYRFYKKKIKKK